VATQILWINLVTDGAPALALGVDAAGVDVMARPPRPLAEGVITGRMWFGIFFVGVVDGDGYAAGARCLRVRGLIEGSGTLRYGQTMAFTTLTMFQLFNVFNARSDEPQRVQADSSAIAGCGRPSDCRSRSRWRWSISRSCNGRFRP